MGECVKNPNNPISKPTLKDAVQACADFTTENMASEKPVPFADERLKKRVKCSWRRTRLILEKADRMKLIEYGVSLRTAWPTEKGNLFLAEMEGKK